VIKNESELRPTFEQLERMQRALASLRDDVLPVNPKLFAVMAEGPLDYIREFHDDLEAYRLSLLGPVTKHPISIGLQYLRMATKKPLGVLPANAAIAAVRRWSITKPLA
jgi:hypothetical protein